MSVIPKLASSLGRRDEVPNQKLAQQIVDKNDKAAVKELLDHLADNDRRIQSDCIKVLYEIGTRKPQLIANAAPMFVDLLESKNNRLVWGAMTALDAIADENPELVSSSLPKILTIADRGSVITRDHAVGILTKLAATKKHASQAFALLIDQLKNCPPNQFPMYVENALPVITKKTAAAFIAVLRSRIEQLPKDSQRTRVAKVLKRAQKAI
jgi:hypothetical protein